MRAPARRAARVAVLPLLAAATLTLGSAPPALACGTLVCDSGGGATNDGSSIGATSWSISISVQGGQYPSLSAPVSVPNRVPPPCYYTQGRSGAEMAADHEDPSLRRLAHGVGENFEDWFPSDYQEHADEDGYWWWWECSSANFAGSTKEFMAYVDQWSASNPSQVWVPAGQAPPQPPVPPAILAQLAYDAMAKTIRMPLVSFNPAERSFVSLETWMWLDPAAMQPVTVTAAAPNSTPVRVTATPTRLSVSGLPDGSTADTRCAGGGEPYAPGAETDCSITFGRSSGGQPDDQWHFQVSLTWDVTATAPLTGPPTIVRFEDEALTVLESQAVGRGDR